MKWMFMFEDRFLAHLPARLPIQQTHCNALSFNEKISEKDSQKTRSEWTQKLCEFSLDTEDMCAESKDD